jgi:hypothetical protein
VLLCLAGNWRSISQCVPPVRKALRDLALGRAFPVCGFASLPTLPALSSFTSNTPHTDAAHTSTSTTTTTLRWAQDGFCPVQYRTAVETESGSAQFLCEFTGAIEVTINGQLWNRTWWNLSGDTVTEWSAAARATLPASSTDDRFQRDFERWQQSQPPTAPADEPLSQPEGGA